MTQRAPLLLATLLFAGCPMDAEPGSDAGADTAGTDAPGTDAPRPPSDAPPIPDAPELPDAPALAPTFRNTVDMPDAMLAREALRIMGAREAGGVAGSCQDCHGITRESIAHFRSISDTAWSTCFADLSVPTPAAANAVIECFQNMDGYTATNMGVYAAGGYFEWFRFVFERALGTGWEAEYETFSRRSAMPPATHTALTQREFDIVTEWFLRGTPEVELVLPPTDAPGECTPYIGPSLVAAVEDSATEGWTARNLADAILMYGCAGASTPIDCLSSLTLASDTTYGRGWAVPTGTRHRILFETSYRSSYWTRASADGRFIAHGGGPSGGASFIDLQRGIVISASALYDPGFFPDNSGFLFQGTSRGASVCMQSILNSATSVTFREPECSGAGSVALYQHMGASLDGGDYWAVNSAWTGDNGGGSSDPNVFVDAASSVSFVGLLNTGTGFRENGETTVRTPWEGSAILAQSARLLVTQVADASGDPIGYVIHRVDITGSGPSRTIALPEVGRVCIPGGKPAMSFDDRWLVTHHRAADADAIDLGFTGPSDPAWAAYRGTSNLYLADLTTGVVTRISHMAPGQDALFPHFRSDGWIYYVVKNGTGREYMVATDAALVLGR